MSQSTIGALAAIVTLLVILTACSDDPMPAPARTEPPTASPTATAAAVSSSDDPMPMPTPAPTETPTDTPTATAAAVSFEEYLSICQESRRDDETLDEDATNRELSAMFAETLAEMEAIAPPTEVAGWHDELMSVFRKVIATLDQLPGDEAVDFDVLMLVAATLESDMEEAEANLPDDVHRHMASVDCAVTERFYKPESVVGTYAVGERVRVGSYEVEVTNAGYLGDAGMVAVRASVRNVGGSPVPASDWDASLQDDAGVEYDRASVSPPRSSDDEIAPNEEVVYHITYGDVPDDAAGLTWWFSDGAAGAAFDLTGIGLYQPAPAPADPPGH